MGLGIYFFALIGKLLQCFGIDRFDLYGNHIAVLPKGIYLIEVLKRTHSKLLCKVLARRIGVWVEDVNVLVVADGRLYQHAAKLTSSEYA